MGVLVLTAAVFTFISSLLLLISLDVLSKRTPSQTFGQACYHYVSVKLFGLLGTFCRYRLVRTTRDVQRAQEAFLLRQLQQSAHTAYGREYGLGSVRSVDEFRRAHPLTRYDHYQPYVQRMMDGEEKVLTREQPDVFGVSSGTSSGDSKFIPMLRRQKTLFFVHAVAVLYSCMVEAFPGVHTRLRRSLKIFFNPRWRTCAAGIRVGPTSSSPSTQKRLLHLYATPAPAFDILSEPDALYVYLLFALKDRHLGTIEGNFASLVYNAMVTLQRSLPQLATDIEMGTLREDLDIDPEIRASLEKLLRPDPSRAEEVRRAGVDGPEGLCLRLWPELQVVLTVDSGAFQPYGERLRETLCRGVPLYSPLYAATEGLIGINLWPDAPPSRYLPHPSVQFFEFIPVSLSDDDQPDTLLLHQLEGGKDYELVLTNVSGLFRYRLGDVVRVTGFFNQCPRLEFRYRIGQFLNVRGEKTSEPLFYSALCEAVAQWPSLQLVDYCCAESILAVDTESLDYCPFYSVFLELECTSTDEPVMLSEEQKSKIDAILCRKSYVYASFRRKGSIDPLRVCVVKPGSFRHLRDYAVGTEGVSPNQFKVPRVLKSAGALKLMLESVEH